MLKQKKVTIFTILIMVFNFIMPNTMMIANAVNENEVQKKLISIETSITNTNTLIEEVKGSALYENDSSTRVATDYFEKSFLVDENKFLSIKSLLSEGVRLSELILYADSLDLSDKYTKYINMGNSDVTRLIWNMETALINEMKELLSKYDLNYDEVCQGKSEIEWKVELFIGVMKIIKFNKR